MAGRRRAEWSCGLCEAQLATQSEMIAHLGTHGYSPEQCGSARVALAACEDGPDWYRNRFAMRLGDVVIAHFLVEGERDVDDPMRFA